MKLRNRFLISLVAAILAAAMYARPMWWGTVFSPLTQHMATAEVTESLSRGLFWKSGKNILRFRSLDLLMEFFTGEK